MKRLSTIYGMTVLAAILVSSTGRAQEEPASELSDDDYADDYSTALPEGEAAPGAEPTESATDDTWESYSDLSRVSSVAEDITDGVRVEDIVEPPSDYRYAAFGKPDPFVPPLVTQAEKIEVVDAPGAIEIPIVSMLQKHDLASLRVVGIYSVRSGERKALITTPDGVQAAVSVKIGDPIGNRGGKVLAIGPQTLTVREFTLAADGTRQYDDMEMFLGEPEDQAIGARIRFEPGAAETKIIENDNVVKAVEDGIEDRLVPEEDATPTEAKDALPNTPASPAGAIPQTLMPGQAGNGDNPLPGTPQDPNGPPSAAVAVPGQSLEPVGTPAGSPSSMPAIPPAGADVPTNEGLNTGGIPTGAQTIPASPTTPNEPVVPPTPTQAAPAATDSSADYEGYEY